MRRWAHLTWAAVACSALIGCSGQKQDYKYRIAVIPKGLTHQFWQSIDRGAERAAADLGEQGIKVKIDWVGPRTEDDAQVQINILQQQVAGRASGIVLAPQNSTQMVKPVERAVAAGIPVVVIDSGLDKRDVIVKYVATNNYRGGQLAAEHLLKTLKAEGKAAPKLVLFRYSPGSESTDQREKGFEDHVNKVIEQQKKKGEPAITWLSTNKYAGATINSAHQAAMPLLNGLKDEGIDGIFAPNESSATGMLKALRSLGLNQKVHLMGFDSSAPLLDAVRDGDIDGLIVQDPYKMGYLGVWILVQHLEGHDVAPDGDKDLSTGEHVVTKENLDEQSTRELFDEELQKRRKIEPPTFPKKE
jgi:ribose transport system substrate-binding protein